MKQNVPNKTSFYLTTFFAVILCFIVFSTEHILAQGTPLYGIINNYTKVLEVHYCSKSVDVSSTYGFSVGQKVLLIQMQGAIIDESNTASFGSVLNYNNTGNAEVLEIERITGANIQFTHSPMLDYSPGIAPVQLVTMPSYDTATISIFTEKLTCQPWNGSTGGVLAFDVRLALDLSGTIDISERGFVGGTVRNDVSGSYSVFGYVFARNRIDSSGEKGEGISLIPSAFGTGRGAPANGGGGGNSHNAGGGGGSNGGAGGIGSFDFPNGALHNGGVGGYEIPYQQFIAQSTPRLVMGGGGGAGHMNNNVGTNGGKGGAIAYIRANNVIIRPGAQILNNGQSITKVAGNDGAGGGGAGGTIVFDVNRFISFGSKLNVEAQGGYGGRLTAVNHGPGGGGGGGAVFFLNSIDSNVSVHVDGGIAGFNISTNSTYGADSGAIGIVVANVKLPESTKSVVEVSAGKDTTICEKTPVILQAIPKGGRPPYTFTWQGQNIADPNKQSTSARPGSTESYTVLITDSLGCVNYDKVLVFVNPSPSLNLKEHRLSMCKGDTLVLQAESSQELTWFPTQGLLENKGNTVRCITDSSRTYTVQAETVSGCFAVDTIRVDIIEAPSVTNLQRNSSLCADNDSIRIPTQFFFGGQSPYTVTWSTNKNGIINSDSVFRQIIVKPDSTTVYYFSITDKGGCTLRDSVIVTVLPSPLITLTRDTLLCKGASISLIAEGADTYSWTPITGLSNPSIANPIANPMVTTTYTVTASYSNGCSSTKDVRITVVDPPAKPIVKQVDDTLFVIGQSTNYEWYRNDSVIQSSPDTFIIIHQSGFYSCAAISKEGCKTLSDSLFISIGSAIIEIDTITVNNGQIKDVHFYLKNQQSIVESNAHTLELTVAWNPTVTSLLGSPIQNIGIFPDIDSAFAILRFPLPPLQNELGVLQAKGLLGNATKTAISIQGYTVKGGALNLVAKSGEVNIGDICYEGGTRLWLNDKQFSKAAITVLPHPIESNSSIHVNLPEKGWFCVKLVSLLGNTTVLAEGNAEIGHYTLPLSRQDYSSGMHFLILETPTERVSTPIMIIAH